MTDRLDLYGGASLALLTDLYQLTMAQGYWMAGVAEREAVFHLTFRRHPFGGAYAVAAGLEPALDYLSRYRFDASDLEYLAGLQGGDGKRLFDPGFVAYLGTMKFDCTVDAVPEGSVVFAHEPLLRVQGPVLAAQLVETPLLNIVNFQTLIATKAARVVQAARGEPVVEFGLRRAQGPDGGISASRASYLGGCAGTSNVLAGKLLGIPVKGTHAHSWVMFHDDELTAFRAYAASMPNNCTFLVDTYDTLQGVRHAITVGEELRAKGHALAGVRLDSGDLAHLSIEARKLLDAAGFPDAKIVASNDLDEGTIASLEAQGARIDVWGVGTKMVTAYDQPALGGVYKLGAVRGADGGWQHKIKVSEQVVKISNPGVQQVRRYRKGDELVADVIYDQDAGLAARDGRVTLWDLEDQLRSSTVEPAEHDRAEDLLVRVMDRGVRVGDRGGLEGARARAARDLAGLSVRTRRFLNPQPHRVGLDPHVHRTKAELIAAARSKS